MVLCDNKICPVGKICNPKTGRCIKEKAKKATSCQEIKCPIDKICNPKTLRCIKQKQKMIHNKKNKSSRKMDKTSNDRLYFYSKSKDVAPGKGANEYVENPTEYSHLSTFKDWRKVLSNFHVCPFKYEGKTYNTIEHVFQAKKIALADAEKASYFTVESGHEIGKGDGELARKNRKLCKLNYAQLRAWAHIKDVVMHNAAVAKYNACKEASNILKATQYAQLWHIVSRAQPVRFEHLEQIRSKL